MNQSDTEEVEGATYFKKYANIEEVAKDTGLELLKSTRNDAKQGKTVSILVDTKDKDGKADYQYTCDGYYYNFDSQFALEGRNLSIGYGTEENQKEVYKTKQGLTCYLFADDEMDIVYMSTGQL